MNINMFYESGTAWFDTLANICVWVLIAAIGAFLIWISYDVITGPRKQRAEISRMLAGIEKQKQANSPASESTAPNTTGVTATTSPFAPKNNGKTGGKGGKHKVDLTTNS